MRAINEYFVGKQTKFVKLEGVISDDLFVDHTHFMPEGNKEFALLLVDNFVDR